MASDTKPFVLIAEVSTKPDKRAEAGDLLRPVAEFESKQDPCGSYVALAPLEGDDKPVTVFETYDDASYLENVHMKSDAFVSMRESAPKSDIGFKSLGGKRFRPAGGYLWRDQVPSSALKDDFVWIARFKAHAGKRDEFMEAILTHAGNVQRTESETLSFLALESTEDDVSIVLFERYTTKKYFDEVHFTSDSMKEFRSKIQPLLAERVSGGYKAVAGFVDKREALA